MLSGNHNRLADTTQELDFNGTVCDLAKNRSNLKLTTQGEMVTKWGLNQQRTLNKFTGGHV